ncbi:hypothetical protein [Paenibacillus lentus]|uniref:Uncharacterized protein n=1 Tax=Paenibacillus lentus TaxID=1338368 RepID=A0A3S8RVQ7_9BACL|nr:hypothetical protein [Paenibacillus lentus]AZK47151.1 hypothetical protein EIM92_14085 [Paenibacillus lentus]
MKSVSFLCGALVGAAAVIWSTKRNGTNMGGNSSSGIMKLAGLSTSSSGKESGQQPSSKASSTTASESKVYPSSPSSSTSSHSKEYNIKQITDFIKGNADVRREVEQILKETNSVIPGL